MPEILDLERIKQRYLAYLKVERGLSVNTASAYSDDVDKLTRYLADAGVAVERVTHDDLERFVCTLRDLGIGVRSQARIISGVKSFYRFLKLEGYVDKNPTRLLVAPHMGRHLPDVLTVEEIDRMIDCIDMSKPEGQRNRAIIETLYGCGLRVSELVGLRMSQIYVEEEYIVVQGKGDKQRAVPISPVALQQIDLYLRQTRSTQVVRRGSEDILFLNRRGGQMSRVMVFYIVKELCELAGIARPSVRTHCVIPLPRTCSKAEPTCAPFSRCWAMKAYPLPKSMCTSTAACSATKSSGTIPATSR